MNTAEREAAYDKIDRYLRNNLSDADYAEYSAALECVWQCPSEFEQWAERVSDSSPADCKPGAHELDPDNGMCRKCFAATGTPT